MKALLFIFMIVSTVCAGVYDYGYSPLKDTAVSDQNNSLFYGDFDRIIRYQPIHYRASTSSQITREWTKIEESLKGYVASSKPYTVSVVARTRTNDNPEFQAIQKTTFFGAVQDVLMESHPTHASQQAACNRALDDAKAHLVAMGVDEKRILLECRNGKDPILLENDGDARAQNYTLNVTLYH
jgi:hypothetical protein